MAFDPLTFTDHVYKSSIRDPSPVIIWIHGGGWIEGARYILKKKWVWEGFHDLGYTLVAIDHRLTPQVLLKDIVEDAMDAYSWVRQHINSELSSGYVDVDRIVVGGQSAGGTLASLLGVLAQPPPKAVIDLYGVVDFNASRLLNDAKPANFYPRTGRFTEEEIVRVVATPSAVEVISHCPRPPTEGDSSMTYPPHFEYSDRHWLQLDLKNYMIRNGGLIDNLFGYKSGGDRMKYDEEKRKLSVLNLLDGLPSYPPTYVVHGNADSTVEIEQSDRFVDILRAKGVPVEYARRDGAGHGCDVAWMDKSTSDGQAQIEAVLSFVDRAVRGGRA